MADFFADTVELAVNAGCVTTPTEGVQLLAQIDAYEAKLEINLKAISKLRNELETVKLPELFDNADMTELGLPDGTKAKAGLDVTGSLPKPGEKDTDEEAAKKLLKRITALEWANSVGWGPMIKASVTLEWDKGDAHKADAAVEMFRGDNSVKMKRTDDIHASTLKAQVRDRLKKGLDVPLDILGVTVLPAVKLTKKPKRADV